MRTGLPTRAPLQTLRVIYHLPRFFTLTRRLLADPRVPFFVKTLPYAALAYVIMPIDLLPDFVRGPFGHLDDLVVVYLLMKAFFNLCPPEIVQEHLATVSKRKGEASAKRETRREERASRR